MTFSRSSFSGPQANAGGGYSLGMRQRLVLAAALLGHPRVLVLDEPANGLDPDGIRWLRGFFEHLATRTQRAVSSHQLNEVQEIADRMVILDRGRLVRRNRSAKSRRHRHRRHARAESRTARRSVRGSA